MTGRCSTASGRPAPRRWPRTGARAWPNRVRDGRYRFDGQDLQLGLTEAAKGNAIHGLVRWVGWAPAVAHGPRGRHGDDCLATARLPVAAAADGDVPPRRGRARGHPAARNESEHPAPYGVGQHPYLAAPGGVDSAVLTVPADRRLLMDDRSVPVGDEPVDGTPYDFRPDVRSATSGSTRRTSRCSPVRTAGCGCASTRPVATTAWSCGARRRPPAACRSSAATRCPTRRGVARALRWSR